MKYILETLELLNNNSLMEDRASFVVTGRGGVWSAGIERKGTLYTADTGVVMCVSAATAERAIAGLDRSCFAHLQ